MISEIIINKAKEHFPDLQVKFKDENLLMRILSYLLFFNKSFMTQFTTTIGSTIYFPSQKAIDIRPLSYLIVLLHELVHINDSKKYSKLLFSLLYLMPQILVLFCLPLFFVFSWKIMLPITILCALPIPAYFRMVFEKRAYMVSLYVANKLSINKNFKLNIDSMSKDLLSNFKNSSYYFMWLFSDLDKKFEDAAAKIKNGERPYDDKVFDIIDDILKVC